MAFATSTLVNGEWTTRTLDVDTVLRHYDQQDKEANANVPEVEKAPALGLLTQTVIRSPLVHWILPARLRSPNNNDVAFIGVRQFYLCSDVIISSRFASLAVNGSVFRPILYIYHMVDSALVDHALFS
jgi:hypothetical protein